MRIAVTGHTDLAGEAEGAVYEALRGQLRHYQAQTGSLTGISCLARGADSVFAEAVLDLGGALEVILPSQNYRVDKVKPQHIERFDRLLARAAEIKTMPFPTAGRDAYEAANTALLDAADHLFAVWDGNASARSGTGTVVEDARERGLEFTVVWPASAYRDS